MVSKQKALMLHPEMSSTCMCCLCRRVAKGELKLGSVYLMATYYTRAKHSRRQKPTAAPSVPSQRSPSPALNLASKLVSSPTQPRWLAGANTARSASPRHFPVSSLYVIHPSKAAHFFLTADTCEICVSAQNVLNVCNARGTQLYLAHSNTQQSIYRTQFTSS